MDIEFSQLRHFLTRVKLQLDVNFATLISELGKEDWVCWNNDVPKGHENPNWNYRFRLDQQKIKSRVVKDLLDFIQSSETKNKAIESLYSYGNTFQGLWSMTKEEMYDWTNWHAELMLDLPGFYLEPHNDYRRLVAAGMIYFTEKDDITVSTTFYTDRNLNDAMTMSTNYGDGWLAVNDYCNWHTGANRSNYHRYSVLLGLTIKKPNEYERI